MSDTRKVHICVEAVDARRIHYYIIYSLKLSDLSTRLPHHQPTLFQEIRFRAPPSMGCGLYDSKILFAGGQLSDGGLHNGLISFDMSTQELSYEPLPSMQYGKLKPLVYQLDDRLYVMDTRSKADIWSDDREFAFEYFDPTKQEWYSLSTPMDGFVEVPSPPPHSNGYPSVVLGNACFLSTPYFDGNYLHHPSVTYKSWLVHIQALPFSGVATSYHHKSLNDSLIISFTKGLVEIHLFDVYRCRFIQHEELFKVGSDSTFKYHHELYKYQFFEPDYSLEELAKSYEIIPLEHGPTTMCGYFADFGDGVFTLSASDDGFLYVYTFKFDVMGVQPDGSTDLKFRMCTKYQYPIDALCRGLDILGVVGCFPSSTNPAAKERAVEIFDQKYQRYGRRYDDDPRTLVFKGGEKFPVPKYHRDGKLSC